MLVESLMTLIYNFFDTIFVFSIPSFDWAEDIYNFIDTLLTYGVTIYKYFIPPFGQACLLLIIGLELAVDLYFIVMWILKKIPLFNIH